jgi:hypothetical protein
MLIISTKIPLKRAVDGNIGNVQLFLERLLIEVISENYRYFLSESISDNESSFAENAAESWPPLLANERQVSGLFAIGLSRASPISRPEYPIDRIRRIDNGVSKAQSSKGRIDFIARYGHRDIALELKCCSISTIGGVGDKKGLRDQWQVVSRQSKEALAHMRNSKYFDSPVSVGLLIIRPSRKVTKNVDIEAARQEASELLERMAEEAQKATRADFFAHYVPPKEMQISAGWGDNFDQFRIFPGVLFAAVVHGSTKTT